MWYRVSSEWMNEVDGKSRNEKRKRKWRREEPYIGFIMGGITLVNHWNINPRSTITLLSLRWDWAMLLNWLIELTYETFIFKRLLRRWGEQVHLNLVVFGLKFQLSLPGRSDESDRVSSLFFNLWQRELTITVSFFDLLSQIHIEIKAQHPEQDLISTP